MVWAQDGLGEDRPVGQRRRIRSAPVLDRMTGQDRDVVLCFGSKVARALKPTRHAGCARVIGGGGEAKISKPLPETGQKLRRLGDRGLRVVRIGEPALGGCRRHELCNAARPSRAHGVGAEAAFLPDQPAQELDRESMGPRRCIDDPANRVDGRTVRRQSCKRSEQDQNRQSSEGRPLRHCLGLPFILVSAETSSHIRLRRWPSAAAFGAQFAAGGRSPLPLSAPGAQFTPSRMA